MHASCNAEQGCDLQCILVMCTSHQKDTSSQSVCNKLSIVCSNTIDKTIQQCRQIYSLFNLQCMCKSAIVLVALSCIHIIGKINGDSIAVRQVS